MFRAPESRQLMDDGSCSGARDLCFWTSRRDQTVSVGKELQALAGHRHRPRDPAAGDIDDVDLVSTADEDLASGGREVRFRAGVRSEDPGTCRNVPDAEALLGADEESRPIGREQDRPAERVPDLILTFEIASGDAPEPGDPVPGDGDDVGPIR